jgi:hypothetical protein
MRRCGHLVSKTPIIHETISRDQHQFMHFIGGRFCVMKDQSNKRPAQAFPYMGGPFWSSRSNSAWLIQTAMRRWFRSSKLLEWQLVRTFLYVGNPFCALLLLPAAWARKVNLQSGGCITYLYMFHIVKYHFYCTCLGTSKQHLYLSCEKCQIAGLDDSHISFCKQNHVLIACVPRIIYFTHMEIKCSQIAKCHE